MKNGKFVISLDFELHWGGVELWNLEDKKDYFTTTRAGIPLILDLFTKYNIHCTWATVGFLFAKDLEDLNSFLPDLRPSYNNSSLYYYSLIEQHKIGVNEVDDPFHYGASLINKILDCKNQELASHTFCHYYCNEDGQNIEQFEADIYAAQKISISTYNTPLKSLVFPRNQFNKSYLEIAKNHGIQVFRSNPNVWFWKYNFGKLTSVFRAFDTLFSISGSLSYKESEIISKNGIVELPASRFFRPYVEREKFIRRIRLNRIINEMTYAAKNNRVYHLWWHPHNFGAGLAENLEDLEIILSHFKKLKKEFNFESVAMKDFIN